MHVPVLDHLLQGLLRPILTRDETAIALRCCIAADQQANGRKLLCVDRHRHTHDAVRPRFRHLCAQRPLCSTFLTIVPACLGNWSFFSVFISRQGKRPFRCVSRHTCVSTPSWSIVTKNSCSCPEGSTSLIWFTGSIAISKGIWKHQKPSSGSETQPLCAERGSATPAHTYTKHTHTHTSFLFEMFDMFVPSLCWQIIDVHQQQNCVFCVGFLG